MEAHPPTGNSPKRSRHGEPNALGRPRNRREQVRNQEPATLDAVMFTPALEAAQDASEERLLYAEAMKPVWRVIAEDDDAAAPAARKLMERVGKRLSADPPKRSIYSRGGAAWSFGLTPGTSVFVPPFDTCERARRKELLSLCMPIP